MPGDHGQVDDAAGDGVELLVVGGRVGAPEFGVGKIGELGPVVEPEEVQEPEHDVAVGTGVGDDYLGVGAAVLAVDEIDQMERISWGAGNDDAASRLVGR